MEKFVFILKSVVVHSIAGGIIGALFGLIYYAGTPVHPHMPFPYWLLSCILLLTVAFTAAAITSTVLLLVDKLKLGVVSIATTAAILVALVVFIIING